MDGRRLATPQKKTRRLKAWLVFIDESGMLLLPTIRRTLAPRGETPVLKHRARHRDKVSVAAAICLSPTGKRVRMITATYPNKYVNSAETAVFLKMLVTALRRPLIAIWDRGMMHRGDVIRDVLRRYPKLTAEFLPPYAPQLNPPEALWNHIKADVLANFTPKTVADILHQIDPLLESIQHDQKRLRSFLAASPLFGEGGHIN